jgi:predicted transcriptional regulator
VGSTYRLFQRRKVRYSRPHARGEHLTGGHLEIKSTLSPTRADPTDAAELVWRLCADYTQKQVGKALGWTQPQVSQYVGLKKIASEAWQVIITTFQQRTPASKKGVVIDNITAVISPFSENLLRDIVNLTPAQQLLLCTLLAKGKEKGHAFTKNDFTNKAALEAGITEADIFVGEEMDDAAMVRVYVRENATQRGMSSAALTGAVAAAIKYVVKCILTGTGGAVDFNSTFHLPTLRERLLSDDGVGRDVIAAFLHDIPGISKESVRQQLANLKTSGDYARLMAEVEADIDAYLIAHGPWRRGTVCGIAHFPEFCALGSAPSRVPASG